MGLCIVGSICWYALRQKVEVRGGAWYIALAIFAGCLFIGEFFNGAEDIFTSYTFLNLSQIGSLIIIFFALRGIFTLTVSTDTRNNSII
jgi:prolipoprotein diacylglyceryltransferase